MLLSDAQILTVNGAAFEVGRENEKEKVEAALKSLPFQDSLRSYKSGEQVYKFTASKGRTYIDGCLVGETDEEVVIAFKGTAIPHKDGTKKTLIDWQNNLERELIVPPSFPSFDGHVHQGFSESITRLRNEGCLTDVRQRMECGKSLVITGYSKGGALAPLAALLLVKEFDIDPTQIRLCIFESPKCGDRVFAEAFNALFEGSRVKRYEYLNDLIPYYPFDDKFLEIVVEKMPLFAKQLFERRTKNPDSEQYIAGSDRYQHVGELRLIQPVLSDGEEGGNKKEEYEEVLGKTNDLAFYEKRLKKYAEEVDQYHTTGRFVLFSVLPNHASDPLRFVLGD